MQRSAAADALGQGAQDPAQDVARAFTSTSCGPVERGQAPGERRKASPPTSLMRLFG